MHDPSQHHHARPSLSTTINHWHLSNFHSIRQSNHGYRWCPLPSIRPHHGTLQGLCSGMEGALEPIELFNTISLIWWGVLSTAATLTGPFSRRLVLVAIAVPLPSLLRWYLIWCISRYLAYSSTANFKSNIHTPASTHSLPDFARTDPFPWWIAFCWFVLSCVFFCFSFTSSELGLPVWEVAVVVWSQFGGDVFLQPPIDWRWINSMMGFLWMDWKVCKTGITHEMGKEQISPNIMICLPF